MTQYQKYGRPGWQSRGGQKASLEKGRRQSLVLSGRASWWLPLRGIRDAIEAAGL